MLPVERRDSGPFDFFTLLAQKDFFELFCWSGILANSKLSVSFLGRDCPGVVAAIAGLFGETGCNIEAMSQTMLWGEFVAIFIVDAPVTVDALRQSLIAGLARQEIDLSVIVRPAIGSQWGENIPCEPFVITVDGPDGPGLIGAFSKILFTHGVNIVNLTAILGEKVEGYAMFVFEAMVPNTVDTGRLRRELALEAKNLGMTVSVQHSRIFEAMHRVSSF